MINERLYQIKPTLIVGRYPAGYSPDGNGRVVTSLCFENALIEGRRFDSPQRHSFFLNDFLAFFNEISMFLGFSVTRSTIKIFKKCFPNKKYSFYKS